MPQCCRETPPCQCWRLFQRQATLILLEYEYAQDSGDDPPRPPFTPEVKQILSFDRLTRNPPSRIHIIVEAEVILEPASEEETRAAAEANAKQMVKREEREVTEELIEILVKRIDLSGFKKINYELWRSRKGKLYRLDKIAFSIGSAASDWIDVNIQETSFTNIPHFSGSKQGKLELFNGILLDVPKNLQLGNVYVVELQLKMPIILVLRANFAKIPQSEEELEIMIRRCELDDLKLDTLIRGANPAWK